MRPIRSVLIIVACVCASSAGDAAQTVAYVYDALGRLTNVQVLSGPGNGVTQGYQYDAAGNRVQETASAPGQTSVALSVSQPTALVTSTGVTLTVNVSGAGSSGTVTFTENGAFLGVALVVGGQASLQLEGFPTGSHSIKATYSGDGTYAPKVDVFSINVRDLRWLPAVLDLILSD
jgi:YD repeat-containing protein